MHLKSSLALFVATTGALLGSSHSAQAAPGDTCAELTPAAFDSLIDTLEASLAQATADCAAFCENGAYAVAAQYNHDYLAEVLGQVETVKEWLDTNDLFAPYVTNASASYGITGLTRDTMLSLHHARHWATISAVYHGSAKARLSFDLTTAAIQQLEALGEAGGICYLDQYGPFLN